MMEVPGHSTFPPILRTYHLELQADGKPARPLSQWKVTPGIRRLLEGGKKEEQKQGGEKRNEERRLKEKGSSRPGTVQQPVGSFGRIKNEHDFELRRNKMKASY